MTRLRAHKSVRFIPNTYKMNTISAVISLWALGFVLGFGLGATVAMVSRLKRMWGNEFRETENA